MKIYSIADISKDKVIEFFKFHWGSTKMAISSGVYDCSELDGFAALNEEGDIIGLVTYIIRDNECEIISLDSILEGKGIGTSLINEVENVAVKNNCKLIKVITTNDNLLALRFYQKRGFVLWRIINNAVGNNHNVCVELECDVELISGEDIPCKYGSTFASVIGKGHAEILEDEQEKITGLKLLMKNQTGRDFEIDERMANTVGVIKVTVHSFTAKANQRIRQ